MNIREANRIRKTFLYKACLYRLYRIKNGLFSAPYESGTFILWSYQTRPPELASPQILDAFESTLTLEEKAYTVDMVKEVFPDVKF